MKLYYEIKDTVYIISFDEIDEYAKNNFKGKDVPLHVRIPFKDICPYLKNNNSDCVLFRDETVHKKPMYLITDSYGTDIVTKGHSLLITHCGTMYSIDDDEIPGNYVEA